jgi:outer membrane protein assembly factor BamD
MKRFVSLVSAVCLLAALTVPGNAIIKKKKKVNSSNPLAGLDSKQPDKELYDKAMTALKKGHFDVCRLDLQTLLNTYPDSEYQMRAKLAVGDSWFKEGGSAALTQAESEFKDFETFFPNVPEAAEAQMKVADIYYMQMEKPDRDATNVQRAEQEYRQMLQQYPDSPLVPRAKQKLRDVQEVQAQRQFEIGQFYSTHENYPATIARLQTVTDTYPLFSHSDQALLSLGDAYAGEAHAVQGLNIPPAAKAELMKVYEDRAAAAYAKVVTRYPMAAHVEDAKDRLIAMNRVLPEPSREALAENEAEEQSRTSVRLKDKAIMMVKKGPSTVESARVGEPTLADPPPTLAPAVVNETRDIFNAAITGHAPAAAAAATNPNITNGTAPPTTEQPAAAPGFESVPEGSGTRIGNVEVIAPSGSSAGSGATNGAPSTSGTTPAPGSTAIIPSGAPPAEPNAGLKPVGPTNATALPPVEKPADAPPQVNEATGAGPAQVKTGATANNKKNPKPKFDSSDESSSKHKKKKGLSKINPF